MASDNNESQERYVDIHKRMPVSMFKLNRERLVTKLRENGVKGVIVLKGGRQETRHDTDHEPLFRQESYFHWCFGVSEADCMGAIDIDSGKAILFIPRLPEAYAIWMGKILPPSFFQDKYSVDDAGYVDEVGEYLTKHHDKTVQVLYGRNSDSGNFAEPATFKGIENFTVDKDSLFPIIAGLRVIKTEQEIAVMRYACEVSSAAHVEVMRSVKPDMWEYQLESLFRHYTYNHGGCRHQAYTCICASGPNGAILHYGHAGAPNDRKLKMTDMALLDMGAEYHCYCSDITCTYPVSGKFTEDQRAAYEGVLEAVIAVEKAMKPGISWVAMHDLATRIVLKTLIKMGVLHGSIDEMMAVELGGYFLPCGLGHLIGLDTHDVGGYLSGCPERRQEKGFKSLRTARVLEKNMTLTVEPGVYFMESQIDIMLKDEKLARFVNAQRIQELRHFGGVRIEDVVIVRNDGVENLTQCPRSVEEIEAVMAGGAWPPAVDTMPQLRRVFSKWPTKH